MKRTERGKHNVERRDNGLIAHAQLSAQPLRSLRLGGVVSSSSHRRHAEIAEVAQTKITENRTRTVAYVFFLLLTLPVIGCRRDMQDQPKMKPYRGTTFFGDGLSARQPVEGTVPRGYLRADVEFFTGKKRGTNTAAGPSGVPAGPQPSTSNPLGANAYPDDVETFPFPVTEETVNRGHERFDIFCSACHGLTGYGDGMIVRRGFRRAASFHDDRLRQAPVGHFFDAITNGWGAMPSYASQIPVQDRWAIIAYVRALQLSQQPQTPAATPAVNASPSPAAGGHR